MAVAALVAVALGAAGAVDPTADRPPRAAAEAPPARVVTYEVRGNANGSDLEHFAGQVAETFADPRGWSLGGAVRFVRVPAGGAFTVWLAAPSRVPTFGAPCDQTYSCHQGRNVIINEARWLNGSPAWNGSGASLRDYRHMVVNHETGHWLGFGHSRCPAGGWAAPVMQQQSISLQGCAPNAWPLDGERDWGSVFLGVENRFGTPIGSFDTAAPWWHGVRVTGWAIDPDTAAPAIVDVIVDGVRTGHLAVAPRWDVAFAYPGYGAAHGFDLVVPAAPGSRQVCMEAINVAGRGHNESLGCRTVVVGSPIGVFEFIGLGPQLVRVKGWAMDPDTGDPVQVHVYVDGVAHVRTADRSRGDLAAAFGNGGAHGVNVLVPAPSGPRRVCLYGINAAGRGTSTALGCRTVVVGGAPFGSLDAVVAGPGAVQVRGWTIDRDTAAPARVHVYVDSSGTEFTADGDRPDLGKAFPLYGAAHGFERTVPAAPGLRRVCVFGIDGVGPGGNTALGCRWLVVGGAAIGSLDGVTAGAGSVRVRGWALDPDTANPSRVHVYVDGAAASIPANGPRPDLARAYPLHGLDHGFDRSLAATPGPHSVCAYAIDITGPGGNGLLGCRMVVVP